MDRDDLGMARVAWRTGLGRAVALSCALAALGLAGTASAQTRLRASPRDAASAARPADGASAQDDALLLLAGEVDCGLLYAGASARLTYAPAGWPLAAFARAGLWGYSDLFAGSGHAFLLEPGVALVGRRGSFIVLAGGTYGSAWLSAEECGFLGIKGDQCTTTRRGFPTASATGSVDLLYGRGPGAWFAGGRGGVRFMDRRVMPFVGGTFGKDF
jgi:hypothetical protein